MLDWSAAKLATAITMSGPRIRLSTRRKEEIVRAYVLATGGRLPTDLDKLLAAMRARMGAVSESEVRAALDWSLRRSRRAGAAVERKLGYDLSHDALAGRHS